MPDWWWNLSLAGRQRIALAVVIVIVAAAVAGVWRLTLGGDDGSIDTEAASGESGADQAVVVERAAADFVAGLDPARVDTWDQLAECETLSVWDRNTGNGFYGGLQFTAESWTAVGGTGLASEWSRNEQIRRAELLFDEQGWSAWPGCSAELGLS